MKASNDNNIVPAIFSGLPMSPNCTSCISSKIAVIEYKVLIARITSVESGIVVLKIFTISSLTKTNSATFKSSGSSVSLKF